MIPATLATEYAPVVPAQTPLAAPMITPGVEGLFREIVNVFAMLLPQALFATTLSVPETVKPAV